MTKKCIGVSKEFAEEWNRSHDGEDKFIYIDDCEKFGYVMRSYAFKDYPDNMS